jgi:putative ABC transport system permease protein
MRTPPSFLDWLLDALSPPSRPDLKGDLLEAYDWDCMNDSAMRANIRLFIGILSIVPFRLIVKEESNLKSPNMIFSHLKAARRHLRKNMLYTSINIAGLTLSLTACVLIALFVRDELSFDQHLGNKESIMRIGGVYKQGGKDQIKTSVATTWMLQPLIEGRVGGIESSVRIDFNERVIDVEGKEYVETGVLFADSTFFDIFSFPLLSGDRNLVLDDPTAVVIDRTTAMKFYGSTDVIGKLLSMQGKVFHITGVMENIPHNTHFTGNIVLPMSGVQDTYPDWVRTNISGRSVLTYIRIGTGFNETTFSDQVKKAVIELWPDNTPDYFVQPVPSIHLGPKYDGEVDLSGSKADVYIFAITAFVILLLAVINYINLSIAAALPRGKEAGVKKVLGSTNGMLVGQFQTESVVVLAFSAMFALVLSWVMMPVFNQLSGKNLSFGLLTDPVVTMGFAAVVIIIALVAGALPALSLLRSGTIRLLSNKLLFRGRRTWFSNGLIVFQFSIAAGLIACTLVAMDQIQFIRGTNIGLNPNQLLMIPLQAREISARYDVLKIEMLKVPGVTHVTGSTDKLTGGISGWRPYERAKTNETVTIPTVTVAHDFFETIGAEMADGRSFSTSFPADFNKSFVINESAARLLGYEKPLGANLEGGAFNNESWYSMHAQVIGVVKDFHFSSLHSKVEPAVFSLSSEHTPPLGWMEVRIHGDNATGIVSGLAKVWEQLAPERSFQFEFVDDALKNHYVAERKFLSIFAIFSSLAIVLGAMGLFGLTAFMTERRTKEIGIRKVVGATTGRLIRLLSKDFLLLVAIANIIGWPVAWYFMKSWLANFAVQTNISVWIFIATGGAAMTIAFLAILYHSLKVSRANPVKALRWE